MWTYVMVIASPERKVNLDTDAAFLDDSAP